MLRPCKTHVVQRLLGVCSIALVGSTCRSLAETLRVLVAAGRPLTWRGRRSVWCAQTAFRVAAQRFVRVRGVAFRAAASFPLQ